MLCHIYVVCVDVKLYIPWKDSFETTTQTRCQPYPPLPHPSPTPFNPRAGLCDTPQHRYRQGAAYVVFGRPDGDFEVSYDLKLSSVVDGETAISLPGVRAQDALGISVGYAGDMNGDGVSDLWVS